MKRTGSGYVQVDETPVRYLAPGHGLTKMGYFWPPFRPGGDVVSQWHTSRAASYFTLVSLVPSSFTTPTLGTGG
jgi:hypothetical protein